MPERRWATREQTAEYVGVHVNTIDRWRTDGRIRGYQAGPRLVRFDLNDVDAMLAGATTASQKADAQ